MSFSYSGSRSDGYEMQSGNRNNRDVPPNFNNQHNQRKFTQQRGSDQKMSRAEQSVGRKRKQDELYNLPEEFNQISFQHCQQWSNQADFRFPTPLPVRGPFNPHRGGRNQWYAQQQPQQRFHHMSHDVSGHGVGQQTRPPRHDRRFQSKHTKDSFRKHQNWNDNSYSKWNDAQPWRANAFQSGYKKDPVVLGKTMSYLLRHGAQEAGLEMQSDGFTFVYELLQCHGLRGRYTEEDVRYVVSIDKKQRYLLKVDPSSKRLMIRANQGHTVEVPDLELELISDASEAPVVIHGTFFNIWPAIEQQGLSRMARNHIHFSVGKPGDQGVKSGMRSNCEVLIYINIKKAMEDGIQFFRSANGVILSPGDDNGLILPKYFERVEQRFAGNRKSSYNSGMQIHHSEVNEGNPKRRKHTNPNTEHYSSRNH